jgi:hypothetical protein
MEHIYLSKVQINGPIYFLITMMVNYKDNI